MSAHSQPLPPGMGLCQVTGRTVPEDELVTIQGQRVCAEGKAILLERLRSGEAMPGELVKPTVLRRFGAILLDVIIVAVPMLFVGMGVGMVLLGPGVQTEAEALRVQGVTTLLAAAVSTAYFALLHARNGQTVGKMAAKLRVVNDRDGSPITPATAWVRALWYAGPNFVSGLLYLTGAMAVGTIGGLLVGGWGLANVIVALVDSDRQRALHDRLAGTRVVQTEL